MAFQWESNAQFSGMLAAYLIAETHTSIFTAIENVTFLQFVKHDKFGEFLLENCNSCSVYNPVYRMVGEL